MIKNVFPLFLFVCMCILHIFECACRRQNSLLYFLFWDRFCHCTWSSLIQVELVDSHASETCTSLSSHCWGSKSTPLHQAFVWLLGTWSLGSYACIASLLTLSHLPSPPVSCFLSFSNSSVMNQLDNIATLCFPVIDGIRWVSWLPASTLRLLS